MLVRPNRWIYARRTWPLSLTNGGRGALVRLTDRCLTMALACAAAPIAIVVTAPPAGADCNTAAGTTVCAQGEVRGADGVPEAATPVVPYPCTYDWYCGTNSGLDIVWNPGRPDGGIGPGRPGRPR